ncbi:putative polyhydroxyalkanoic acid system protein [Pseudomonas syringae]|uniref:polyhydroxyalkanoic acid system family protein n=1 Tax=Pseudomonas syringae TaxID=317 RepID=UPI0008EE6102|nr:polyhydroxyalkanoic acid system family protein [Pseudomonas syringae]SFI48278.1 putative polyhydroxyalkanoic acid system protein [Pseudomonas syringae]
MAKITVERPHALGLEKAREKAEQLVEKLSTRYGLAHEWAGDTVKLSAMSGSIKTEVERVLDKALAA